jgi:four helix bundle suffix protein
VARASLEELRLDYEDFLRQRGMTMLPPDHPALMRFKKKRCATLQEVQAWVTKEFGRENTDQHRQTPTDKDGVERPMSMRVGERPCPSLPSSALAANAALSLLNLACHFLDRQIAAQAKAFEEKGGFTERLYRVRSAYRRSKL